MERYARQTIVEGWDQTRLQNTSLVVLGSGWLARLVSLLSVAMGFGRVTLAGNGRVTKADQRFFLADASVGDSVVRSWTTALKKVNPDVDVHFVHTAPNRTVEDRLQGDVVVSASNELGWQGVGILLGKKASARVAVAAGPRVGLYHTGQAVYKQMLAFRKASEDPLLALLLAGLVVEEIRRVRMPLGKWDQLAKKPVLVSAEALHGRAGGEPVETHPDAPLVSLVGAGALGTWASIGLGLSLEAPMRLRIFDDDVVDESNLNRQVLFHDAVGQAKARVLAERMRALFPGMMARGFASRVEEADDTSLESAVTEPDLVLSAPDNFKTRAVLNRAAVDSVVPIVNGGTSAFGGDVTAYVPGKSACLSCALQVDRIADVIARCGQVSEASVVTANAIAGALMAYEARAVLSGSPALGVMEYDGKVPGMKLGVRSVKGACQCHTGETVRMVG